MEGATGGGVGFVQGIGGSYVGALLDQAGFRESVVYVFAFAVDGGIDFVRDGIEREGFCAVVAIEAYVVGGGDAPERAAIDDVFGFPGAQMIARHRDANGFGVRGS